MFSATRMLDLFEDQKAVMRAVACSAVVLWVSFVGIKGYVNRTKVARLRGSQLPVAPKWNWLTGHLGLLKEIIGELPPRTHRNIVFGEIIRKYYPDEGCCYLDLWPFGQSYLIIADPTLAAQATTTISQMACERPPNLHDVFFRPIAGGPNLFDLPARAWRPWRAIFNKGFGDNAIAALVPGMVTEAVNYRNKLTECADGGKLVQLDLIILRFTMDVTGKGTFNVSLGAQSGYNILAESMLSQTGWQNPARKLNPLDPYNLGRIYMEWRNSRRMDTYIGKELDRRFAEYQRGTVDPSSTSVIDLVLRAYYAEQARGEPDKNARSGKLDPRFRQFAIHQMRLFLFLGHDSMSRTICFIIHLLATHPEPLAALRAEHETVFGRSLAELPKRLSEQPQLLYLLPYTTAVIKEALRLYPPGTGLRWGVPGINLVGADSSHYPTADMAVWVLHYALHRSPKHWVRPQEFLPQRFLVEPGDPLYPRKDAWRAFEHGPRACLGQALSMAQLRLTLAITMREFDFEPGYEEWDRLHPCKGVQTVHGERVYQTEEAVGHPADHYPCTVRKATLTSDLA